MTNLTEGELIELTAGRFKDQFAVVIKQFQEEHFGATWEMAQVVVSHNNKPLVLIVGLETVKVI